MTRWQLCTTFMTALALGAMTSASMASPLQTGRTEPGLSLNPNLVLVINQDQFKGNWKQFKGELKQKWGKFTDDDLLYIEGSHDKYEGRLQERYGDRKEEVKQWTEEWFEKHDFEKDTHDKMR